MNRYLLLSATLVPLFVTGCDKPKPDVSDRLTELEQRVAAAEQEAAEARAAQQETERLLEEQRLAVQRDALERERIQLEQDRAEKERLLDEQARAAEEELRQREEEIARREQSAIDLQHSLSDQQQAIDQREAELSERDSELAGREALPDPAQNAAAPPAPEPEPVDVQVFYDSLSPYGSWFDSPDYGYVWRPAAYRTAGWRPYTHGRWACTDRGWMWISDEPFGWATYHYGRWALCRQNGWIWVPGTQWAPSWVTWRSSGSHIGWAPLPPETLAYRGRRWGSTVEVTFGIGSAWFSFVDIRNFSRPIRTYCLPHTRNEYYWGNTVNITNIHIHNNRVISGGPSYGDIARQTTRRPPFYRIEEDRGGRHAKDRGYNRIQNGRVVVSPPRREESRNPDALMNRPPHVSGRFDKVEVVRTKQLDPDIVREFQKNREQARKTGGQHKEITQRPTQRQEETKPRDRGEEQRRLNEKAQDLEKDARKNVDDRIRVLPRPAGDSVVGPVVPKTPTVPPTKPNNRGEEQRKLNEKAQDLEKDARKNVDDRIRVLPRRAGDNPQQPRVPNPPPVEKPKTPPVSPRQPEIRKPQTPAPPPVLPRREESRNQDNSRQQQAQQQQRQAEEQQRRRATEEQQRQQLQRQGEEARRQQQAVEESRRQQQRQAEENTRRQAEAQRENQRRQQQAAEESRRQQQQRLAEETTRRQEQQRRSLEDPNRRNQR